jgi:hypothetical protein
LALVVGTLLTTVAPASAGSAETGRTGSPSIAVQPGSVPPEVTTYAANAAEGGATTLAGCPITRYGYTGYRVCGFAYFDYTWSDGNVETFVVGTNYSIYHIWATSKGWQSLGGIASPNAPNGAYPTVPLGVWTYGKDENKWCRLHPWTSGWARC